MLEKTQDGPSVVACNTCRFSAAAREDADGRRGGQILLEQLRTQAGDVVVEEMPCLFGCERHCNVYLRAPGKIGYVLGLFEPTAEAAVAILAFFRLYRDSETGVVPYRQWPEGVKGHFVARVPPPGHIVKP